MMLNRLSGVLQFHRMPQPFLQQIAPALTLPAVITEYPQAGCGAALLIPGYMQRVLKPETAAQPLPAQHFSFCLATVTKGQIALPLACYGGHGARGGGLAKAIIASRWSH